MRTGGVIGGLMSKFQGGAASRTDGAILRIAGALVAEYSVIPDAGVVSLQRDQEM